MVTKDTNNDNNQMVVKKDNNNVKNDNPIHFHINDLIQLKRQKMVMFRHKSDQFVLPPPTAITPTSVMNGTFKIIEKYYEYPEITEGNQVIFTDDGTSYPGYEVQNVLSRSNRCWCTGYDLNVDFVAKTSVPTLITNVIMQNSGLGYTAQLKDALVFLNYKKPNLNDARIYNLPDDQQQEQTIDDRNNNNNNNNNKQHKKTINNTNRFNEKINLQLKRPDMIGNWYVRWENHRRKIPIFINGQYKFTCYNINYQLLDTNPISFKWKNDDENAVVQTMVSFNGHQIVWTTTDERYQTIYWHWNGPGLHPCLTNFKQEYAMANILLKDNLKLLEFKKQPTVPRYLNNNKTLKEYNVPPSNGIHQLLHRHHGSDRNNNNNRMKKTSVHDLD